MDLVSTTLHVYDLRPVGSTEEDTQAKDVEFELTDKSSNEALPAGSCRLCGGPGRE